MRLRRAVTIAVVALAIGGAGVALVSAGRVADFFDRQYTAFVTLGGPQGEPTASRLATGAGNRYDYWRIATDAWRDKPIAGIGAGGYDKPYFAQRTTTEDIRQPHSLPLQILAELGIIGALLFAAALAFVGLGVWRGVRALGRGDARAPLLVAALGVVTAWFVHSSVDWMHLLPGLTGVALLGAAVLLRPVGEDVSRQERPASPRSQRTRVLAAVAVGVAITVAALSLSRQGLSERYLHRAQDALAGDPAAALREADRALRLDRELVGAYYAKAAALARFGNGDGAHAVLRDATRREPRNFVTWTLLGDLHVRRGDLRAARESYLRASRLNPRDAELARLAANPRLALDRLGTR